MGKKIVVFDFDGVICNSTEECLITGYNAWMRYNGNKGFVRSVEEVPPALAEYFRPLRSLVRTGGQYFAIFNSFKNGRILSEADFDRACGRFVREMAEFERLFFLCRSELRDADRGYWLDLLACYNGLLTGMARIMERTGIYIVTGKDRDSVQAFLGRHSVTIPDNRIYDTNAARDKAAALETIAKNEKRPMADIIFLDDNINHLLHPRKAGCMVHLAGWGYHLPEHLQRAEIEGIDVLELNDWSERIIREISGEKK
jgi:phosphoglycolate phosphatase-like HAD superfamily hydrolase